VLTANKVPGTREVSPPPIIQHYSLLTIRPFNSDQFQCGRQFRQCNVLASFQFFRPVPKSAIESTGRQIRFCSKQTFWYVEAWSVNR